MPDREYEVKFDIEIPIGREDRVTSVPFAGPPEIMQLIKSAEELQYNAIWGTAFSAPKSAASLDWYELLWYDLLIILSYAAAITNHIRLGAGASFLPYRNPITLAKQVSTLDQISNGRLMLGFGMGGYQHAEITHSELKIYNSFVDDKAEALLLLLNHTHNEVSLQRENIQLDKVNLHPKPYQNPFPVYCPAQTPNNMRRIARLGLNCTIQSFLIKNTLSNLEPLLIDYDRSLSEIDIIAEGELCIAKTHEKAVEKFTHSKLGKAYKLNDLDHHIANNWVGTPNEVTEKISNISRYGITHFLAIHIAGDSLQEREEQMQLFATEIIPNFI